MGYAENRRNMFIQNCCMPLLDGTKNQKMCSKERRRIKKKRKECYVADSRRKWYDYVVRTKMEFQR
jgi:hypothetical protein